MVPYPGYLPEVIGVKSLAAVELEPLVRVDLGNRGVRARNSTQVGAAPEPRVLRLPSKQLAVGTVVQVDGLPEVGRNRSHITNAEHGFQTEILLDLETEAVNGGVLALPVDAVDIRWSKDHFPRCPDGVQVAEIKLRGEVHGRLPDCRKYRRVPGDTIVGCAESAPDDSPGVSEHVISEPEAGPI